MKVGFTCSPFDLLHAGHLEMLRECREQCDYLIVGLNINPSKRGKYPIQSVVERHIQLSGIKYVNEIIPYSTEEELISLLLLKNPDIRFVGEDYRDTNFTGDQLDIDVCYNTRNHKFSSSELKRRVIDSESEEVVTGSALVKENDVYTVRDNTTLDKLTLSSTVLHPLQKTKGHYHDDVDEVYHFISGSGIMTINSDDRKALHEVKGNSFITVNGGDYHQVENTSPEEDLVFACTFNGKIRNH
jgi:glycerol-3-phosphate cytidylyltransferase